MKNLTMAFCLAFIIAFGTSAFAQDSGHDGKSMDMEMDHSSPKGDLIRESTVESHAFEYHLIDTKKQMEAAGRKETNHLMVYIKDPQGHNIKDAKVGYLIEGPDGSKQRAMAMNMGDGFGADVNMGAKGKYTIKTKVMTPGKKFMDEFNYDVK